MGLPRNPDPGFTPGSTPDFGPGSGSNSIAIDRNQNDRNSCFHSFGVVAGRSGSSVVVKSLDVLQNCDAAVRPRSAPPNRTSCLSTAAIQSESVVGSLSESCHSTAANDPLVSASFSAQKILNVLYSSEYASGFFEPAASHLPASPSPRKEGDAGQTPSTVLPTIGSLPLEQPSGLCGWKSSEISARIRSVSAFLPSTVSPSVGALYRRMEGLGGADDFQGRP